MKTTQFQAQLDNNIETQIRLSEDHIYWLTETGSKFLHEKSLQLILNFFN